MQDNITIRDNYCKQGLLRCSELENMVIYTYTDKCVYTKAWDAITLNSRGIIFDRITGECIAHPFPKFFNVNETQDTQENNLPWGLGYKIYEKLDGWLGILYRHNGQYKIATRGSFTSPGAVWATNYLKSYRNFTKGHLADNVTLLFEIISEPTKIIVNYEKEGLYLIGAYDRFTGEEIDVDSLDVPFPRPYVINEKNSESVIKLLLTDYRSELSKDVNGSTEEGYVVRFNNGLRVKIKNYDYLRRARILRNLTPLGIWEHMRNGCVDFGFMESVDNDYHRDVLLIAHNLQQHYNSLLNKVLCAFNNIFIQDISRRIFALKAKTTEHPSAMFCLFDRNYDRLDKYIRKLVRPKNNEQRQK